MNASDERYLSLLKEALCASLYEESAWEVIEGARSRKEKTPWRLARFLRALVRAARVRAASARGERLVRAVPFERAAREEGRDWPCFGFTMVGHRRLENVRFCIEDVLHKQIPGDFLEAGVWRGGTAIWMRALLAVHGVSDRVVWAADSFEGLPPPQSRADGADISHVEHLCVSLERVQSHFERFGLLDSQVRFLKGWFSETLPASPVERLAVLRLDGDLYSSTRDALEALYDRVSPGGWVIVDDYHSWEPCRRAVTEFLERRGLTPQIERVDWTGAFWRV